MTEMPLLSPGDLLLGAEHLVTGDLPLDPGAVERAAALLARQALEMCVAARLTPFGLEPSGVSFKAQLLCLQGTMADKELAREAAALWSSLSTLVHHIGYEIGPTGSDVAGLVKRTRRILERLRPAEKEDEKEAP
jgi:hypothetical protein